MGDQQPYCGSHERPAAFAAVLIAVLLMAVFPCSRCPQGLGLSKIMSQANL